MKLKKGSSRWVLCIFGYALKFPSFLNYSNFLAGLRANLFEIKNYRYYGKGGYYPIEQLCPIVFNLPLGFLVIMKRAQELTKQEFLRFNYDSFLKESNNLPVENKIDSFGIINGKTVAIDYA